MRPSDADGGPHAESSEPLREVDWSDQESPSTAFVETAAVTMDRDQEELAVLYAHVDSEALDALLTESARSLLVEFEYVPLVVEGATDGTLARWPGAGHD